MLNLNLQDLLIIIPVLVIALTFHEFSHAFVAYKLGDPTAKNAGRLTLNPLKHLDILGSLMMIIAHIGWAKPVPINSGYFKNRKKGLILSALAGPISNLLLGFVVMLLWGLLVKLLSVGVINLNNSFVGSIINYLDPFLRILVIVNINLAVFNLIPVPPLDGSRLLSSFIPEESYFRFARYEQYIGLAFLAVVIFLPNVLGSVIGFLANPIYNSYQMAVIYIFGF